MINVVDCKNILVEAEGEIAQEIVSSKKVIVASKPEIIDIRKK